MASQILTGDSRIVLRELPENSIDCVVTSPPYFQQRDYKGGDGEIGNEANAEEFVGNLLGIFAEVRRVLKATGTAWINLGDTYQSKGGGIPCKKSLIGIPWRFALAMIDAGWILRNEIIWAKPNPMPSSAKDRCTVAHEQLFFFTQSAKYAADFEAVKERAVYAGVPRGGSKQRYEQNDAGFDNKVYDTRNKRDVWCCRPATAKGKHHAVFPEDLIEPCVVAGCPIGGTVLDPFCGHGTTGVVAKKNDRNFIGIELNEEFAEGARERIGGCLPSCV